MANAQQVLDGAMQSGSRAITFSNGAIMIAESLSFETEVSMAEDRTITGAPGRTRATAGWTTGKITAQIASSTITATNRPSFGDTFTITGATADANYSDILFWVSAPVPYEEDNDPTTIRKAEISYRRCVSGSVSKSGTW